MSESKIEWTGSTWNPIVGCSHASPGCDHCYAERMAKRLKAMGHKKYADVVGSDGKWTGRTAVEPVEMLKPLRWKKARRIFVCSMGDLFHETVSSETISDIFTVMALCPQHAFQVLTKRPERMAKYLDAPREFAFGNHYGQWVDTAHELLGLTELDRSIGKRIRNAMDEGLRVSGLPHGAVLPNVWLGATVENADYAHRIDALRSVAAAVRFLSIEPMLGPMPNLNLDGIDWVIGGGESGPGARPMRPDWIRGLRDQCAEAGVPFFFKQWGDSIASGAVAAGYRVKEKKGGRMLDGVRHDAYPEARP